jgi:hypothetical protein
MKKIFIALAFLGLFTFFTPKSTISTPLPAPDCYTVYIQCPDGAIHMVQVCSWDHFEAWYEILCGAHDE